MKKQAPPTSRTVWPLVILFSTALALTAYVLGQFQAIPPTIDFQRGVVISICLAALTIILVLLAVGSGRRRSLYQTISGLHQHLNQAAHLRRRLEEDNAYLEREIARLSDQLVRAKRWQAMMEIHHSVDQDISASKVAESLFQPLVTKSNSHNGERSVASH